MSHPTSMKCKSCGKDFVVEVPDALMPMIDSLEFYCGDCEVPE